ncbi:hypothetical protein SAMN05216588_101377 [Pseudomonas flavescens]|uniref:DUF6250 domain-containing protein n=1 Tax=Phytopseudomonas flavescens TaxID=29435 RepID=A0A1G7Y2N4_9GAMM|nr:DUF6250 domain-containing protein [Pseudomonas flavescens]SDG90745.1 hypothetical protein SAMN05216588_101377 [Pseudomonas flavescens]
MPLPACTEPSSDDAKPPEVLFEDPFTHLCAQRWHIEAEAPTTRVSAARGQLLIDSPRGVTVWLRQPLQGAYRIEFRRSVLLEGGPNDRLSDLNQFWAARDPRQATPFTRDGALDDYDDLDLYYVGMGGNYNSTTRFRRYDGSGQRLLLGEYADTAHLLEANRTYGIAIEVDVGGTRYQVDGNTFFQARHDGLPPPGYFGFRLVWSRQLISEFRVVRL